MKQKIIQPISVQEKLKEKGVFLFTSEEFRRIFNLSPTKTKYFLETYTERGLFTRLKKGIYCLRNNLPSDEEIANAIYRPSYISFEYVLSKHGIIPEAVYSITSATTKPTREFNVGNKVFSYFKIKKQSFAGYSLVKTDGRDILIAEPEKALVDYLYFVSLGRKAHNERLNISMLDRKQILEYVKLFDRPGLFKIIQKL